jgi:succinate dehydrogenase hydrophobic anchor subunit
LSYAIKPLTTTTTTTTITNPQAHTYLNLSNASSETSLARPLLIEQHQTLPIYTSPINNEDERTASSASSTTSSTSSSSSIIPNCRSYMTLYFTDMLISAFIITPLVNIHWRGAWDLLDIHLLPDYPRISALISVGIGYFMLYMLYLAQGYLQRFYEKNRHNIMGQIMTRLYTLLLALAYIHQWRGLWNLLDYTSNEWYHLLAETGVCITFLLLMKSVYNLNSAPFIIGVDTESYFLLDSKYTVTVSHIIDLCISIKISFI